MIRTVKGPDSRIHHVALLENAEAIQASIMEVVNGLIRGTIELKRGELVLRALNTAVRNARRAQFEFHSHMVTKIPDYTEPPEPDAASAEATVPSVGTDAFVRPGGPEVPGRSNPSTKGKPAIDPAQRKPPVSVKSPEAPKERKIKAHRASGG